MEFDFLKQKRILLVDDEQELLDMLVSILKEEGYQSIRTAVSIHNALHVISDFRPELAVLDVMLPDGSGFDLMKHGELLSAAAPRSFERGQRLEVLGHPHLQQLGLVIGGPFPNHIQGLAGQVAFDHVQGLNVDDAVIVAIECVDVGRIVFFPQQIHFDGHSVKP